MAQQASTSIISYRPLCLVKPFFGRVPLAALDFPLRKQPTPPSPLPNYPTPPRNHRRAWHSRSSYELQAPGFWPPCFVNKLVKSHLPRLYLLHFIKASPHINCIFIIDSFIAGLAPSPGVVGVNEVAPPG